MTDFVVFPGWRDSSQTRRKPLLATQTYFTPIIASLGFTLIEILISILIVSFIAMLIGTAIHRSFEVREKLSAKAELSHSLRTAQFLISRDIALAYHSPQEEPEPGSELPSEEEENGNEEPPRFTPLFKGSKERLLLSTSSHRRLYRESAESELAIVEFFALPSEDFPSFKQVMRRENVFFDGDPEKGGLEYQVIDPVKDLSFKYYDKENDQWGESWDSSGGTQEGRFPEAISFEIKYLEKEKERSLKSIVRLELANPGEGKPAPKEEDKKQSGDGKDKEKDEGQ